MPEFCDIISAFFNDLKSVSENLNHFSELFNWTTGILALIFFPPLKTFFEKFSRFSHSFDELFNLTLTAVSKDVDSGDMLYLYFGIKGQWEFIIEALKRGYMRVPDKFQERYNELKSEWEHNIAPIADNALNLRTLREKYGDEGEFQIEAERLKNALIRFVCIKKGLLESLFDDFSKIIRDVTGENVDSDRMLYQYHTISRQWELIVKTVEGNYERAGIPRIFQWIPKALQQTLQRVHIPKELRKSYIGLKSEWEHTIALTVDNALNLRILRGKYGDEGEFQIEAERLKGALIRFEQNIAAFKKRLLYR